MIVIALIKYTMVIGLLTDCNIRIKYKMLQKIMF